MAITLTVTEIESPRPIPEGLYKASVLEISEATGQFGEYVKFIFEISDGEYKGVTRSAVAAKKLSKSKDGKASKLFEFVKALSKKDLDSGDSLDLEGLVGTACHILVKNDKEKDGIVYQTISAVMPV